MDLNPLHYGWYTYKRRHIALAGWLRRLEHCLIQQKVVGSIPGQGTCLGCGFDLGSGCVREATNRCFCFSWPPSLKSIKTISSDEDYTKREEAQTQRYTGKTAM